MSATHMAQPARARFCPLHGNSHERHFLLRMPDNLLWHCPACGTDFDENLIPAHPPPSKAQWERKVDAYLKRQVFKPFGDDRIYTALDLYLELVNKT